MKDLHSSLGESQNLWNALERQIHTSYFHHAVENKEAFIKNNRNFGNRYVKIKDWTKAHLTLDLVQKMQFEECLEYMYNVKVFQLPNLKYQSVVQGRQQFHHGWRGWPLPSIITPFADLVLELSDAIFVKSI